ncbi:hypothetical protein F4678DRAFT_52018 [Xylaria arbuscula]|nr:hypothetical protein F4678DRAFT_52018 [Xylaria arbuscula]
MEEERATTPLPATIEAVSQPGSASPTTASAAIALLPDNTTTGATESPELQSTSTPAHVSTSTPPTVQTQSQLPTEEPPSQEPLQQEPPLLEPPSHQQAFAPAPDQPQAQLQNQEQEEQVQALAQEPASAPASAPAPPITDTAITPTHALTPTPATMQYNTYTHAAPTAPPTTAPTSTMPTTAAPPAPMQAPMQMPIVPPIPVTMNNHIASSPAAHAPTPSGNLVRTQKRYELLSLVVVLSCPIHRALSGPLHTLHHTRHLPIIFYQLRLF